MRRLAGSKQFERDYKKHIKYTITVTWIDVLYRLLNDAELPSNYRDHSLEGNWKDHRDCHIRPDLVLIYKKQNNDLLLVRLGSHSELGL
jgi:mRNA interferase YafQ